MLFMPFCSEVEVGRQQLAVEAELLALAAGGKLFLPRGLLADGALVHIVDGLVQLLALGAQALGAVLLGVVALEHGVEGGPLLDEYTCSPYCRGRKKVYSTGFPSGAVTLHGQPPCVVAVSFSSSMAAIRLALLGLGQLVGQQMLPVEGAPCSFPADHRADAGHRLVQGVRHRQVPLTGRRHDGRRC